MGRVYRLERVQEIQRPCEAVFSFFSDAANLDALTPEFLHFRILTPLPIVMQVGARIEYSLSLFGVPLRWRTRITDWQPGVRFVDEQESGPYVLWRHTHEFSAHGPTTQMRDLVEYSEPLGPLGTLAHHLFVERVVGLAIRDGSRDEMRGAVLVLQAFAAQGRAARGCSEQKAARALVRRRPDRVTYALESEYFSDELLNSNCFSAPI